MRLINSKTKEDLTIEKNNKQEKLKEKRIQEETDRIAIFYSSMDSNRKALIIPLIQNAAFMKVTLDDLQAEIKKSGVVEVYQNGANQHGFKQSSALQSYNALIKNYAAVNKTLAQMMPHEEKPVLTISTVIRGKTVFHWKQQMKEEAEDNPDILFMSFEEWLKEKLKDLDSDDEQAEAE